MAWRIEKGGGTCGADEWAVINTDTDETEGCHPTEEDAQAQADELAGADSGDEEASTASATPASVEEELGVTATDCLVADGSAASGGRVFHLGRRFEYSRPVDATRATQVLERARVTFTIRNLPSVTAAGEEDPSGPGRFELIAVPEGVRSEDLREIEVGALTTRPLPIPFMLLTVTSWGHDGAELCGRIDTLERNANNEWQGLGTYSALEVGQRARALVAEQTVRFVSADIFATEWEVIEEGTCEDWDDLFDGSCQLIERILAGSIMGATGCPFAAFPQCVVVPEGTDIPAATEAGRGVADALAAANIGATSSCHPGGDCCDSCASGALVASGYSLPDAIPASWFEDPTALLANLPAGQRKHVTPEGRVYGWLADFETCHTGNSSACITAPTSPSNYAYFRTGSIMAVAPDGSEVRVAVGQLTMGTGHPDNLRAPAMAAKAHYDGSPGAIQVVDAAVGDVPGVGIWFAGAMRPGITDEQLRTFLATDESGDWRPVAGHLELVAIASGVAVPGFPIVHRGLAASGHGVEVHTVSPRAAIVAGEVVGLVAAGMRPGDPTAGRLSRLEARLNRELAAMRDSIAPLVPLAVTSLQERRRAATAAAVE